MGLKTILKRLAPARFLTAYRRFRDGRERSPYEGRPPREVFSEIYRKKLWGASPDPEQPFFSGRGSHDEAIVSAYVDAVRAFIRSLPITPKAVDLGCGDFSVGSQIRPLCSGYTACDVVEDLIDFNKSRYQSADVDFRVLDLVSDPLPDGDIAFIRQVLQHLSNPQIAAIVPRLKNHFTFVVVTEHQPRFENFVPNRESVSPKIRIGVDSGVVLTAAPFFLESLGERVLCEAHGYGGVIRTTVYQLRPRFSDGTSV
jgi:hypothetical protein